MRARKFLGDSTIAGTLLALVFFASPLAAQKTSLTLANATVTFLAPTAADYVAGFVTAGTPVTFTLASNGGGGGARTTTVLIRATSASLGGGKVIGDLQWRRSDLSTWNSIGSTDVQIEQRVLVKGGTNDPWSNTIFFRMLLSWTTDAPGPYAANYVITLSQTP